jgi:serine/threonine protein kinase
MSSLNVPKVGAYQFIRFLGSGGVGQVCEVKHTMTGELFACKILEMSQMMIDDFFRHFKAGVLIHTQIEHPGIIQIRDILVDQNRVYLVMELCDGGNLNDLVMKSDGLSEADARRYMRSVIEALSYIHELGVAHRDIKLENILVTSDGQAKLSDFDLSKLSPESELMATRCGTFFYTAPEVLRGDRYNGVLADIWSAGIVLYTMVTNHFPWIVPIDSNSEDFVTDITRQILEGDITPPSGSWELQELIGAMLNPNAEERPSALEVLQSPWMEMEEEINFAGRVVSDGRLVFQAQNVITEIEAIRRKARFTP